MPSGDRVLPFLKQFYSSPSIYVLEDDMGTQLEVTEGEGGEQWGPINANSVLLGATQHPCSHRMEIENWQKSSLPST